ncbi:hypothetical protein ACO0RG_003581 [Hanseniaspora osmophila]|uniref:Na(+)/H(+) antiporter 1 n=1 Tax=Hanseniaspora osmophila TaxID=56408 RepID=A0A1E5RFN5_9ASCO|nr:Na(+)/H(+) antiporter 1 [Hanseniaspora osmophila]
MVWSHLDIDQQHINYLCISLTGIIFCLTAKFFKNSFYVGEALFFTASGIILGPICLKWCDPFSWTTNVDKISVELSRIILCIQLFTSGLELPSKYMQYNFKSVLLLLIPVMTAGWLIVGSFIYLLIPGFKYKHGLLVAGCITATDPILCQSIVSGKYSQKYVPERLRHLITAESGVNDGLAFPFVYLSLFLIVLDNHKGEILKEFFAVTILYTCILGTVVGLVLGWGSSKLVELSSRHGLIDEQSVHIYYIFLSLLMAGMGSLLGMDELLISFFGGCAFGWDGFYQKNVSSSASPLTDGIDYLLNILYFAYFGTIIPWQKYNNPDLYLSAWRLILIGVVVVFLRRLPVVFTIFKWIPAIKNLRESLFVGWFGPIGVGAVFTSLLAKDYLEKALEKDFISTNHANDIRLGIDTVWVLCSFIVVVSMIIHGFSVPAIMFSKYFRKQPDNIGTLNRSSCDISILDKEEQTLEKS